MSGKLTSFSGFCTLSNFYLNFIGINKVISSYTKSSAGNLFDCTSDTISVFKRFESFRIFTSFTCIASSTDPVHCNSKCFMCLTAY